MIDLSSFLHLSIKRCCEQGLASLSVPAILTLIEECFAKHVDHIIALPKDSPTLTIATGTDSFEARFDEAFAIGPGCLDLVIDTLNILYDFVHDTRLPTDNTTFKALTDVFHIADNTSKALLKCLQHLRLKHPRRLWDPKGFRTFGERVEQSGHLLSVFSSSFLQCVNSNETQYARLLLRHNGLHLALRPWMSRLRVDRF